MCLAPKPPKPPKPPAPPPAVAPPSRIPAAAELAKPQLLRDPTDPDSDKPKIEYGAKPSDRLLARKRTNQSIIPLNRNRLATPSANRGGVGGSVAS